MAKRKWALSGKTEVGVQLAKRKWALSGVTGAALVGVLTSTSSDQWTPADQAGGSRDWH